MSTAENDLRCNNFKCRVFVATEGKAVVTTCSHVFCLNCVNQLFSPNAAERTCPACDEALPEDDDVVVSCLNPSNDYRSSVLAGLAPGVILDIATRAIGFWTYQSSQEIGFQTMALKNSKEQVARLEQELNIVRGELHNTQRRNAELEEQLNAANRTTQNAIQDARDKDKDMTKLRAHYDKMKRKSILGPAAQAVEEDFRPLSAVPQNLRPTGPLVVSDISSQHQNSMKGPDEYQRAALGTPNHRPHPYHASPIVPGPSGLGGLAGISTPVRHETSAGMNKRFQGLAAGSRDPYGENRKPGRYGGAAF